MSDRPAVAEQRVDFWLWCARFRRARTECAEMVVSGAVRINRRPVERPGSRVRPGDVLTISLGPPGPLVERDPERPVLGGRIRVVRVLALSDRRGSGAEAERLFEEIEEG